MKDTYQYEQLYQDDTIECNQALKEIVELLKSIDGNEETKQKIFEIASKQMSFLIGKSHLYRGMAISLYEESKKEEVPVSKNVLPNNMIR